MPAITLAAVVSVVSFNIHHGTGEDERSTLAEQAALVAALGADIVALQECDVRTTRSGGLDQVAEIARLAGFAHHAFGHNLDYRGGGYGCAILSRLPLRAVKNVALPMITDAGTRPHVDGKIHKPEPRGLLSAVVDLGGQDLLVLTTHASIWTEEREMAAAVIVERVLAHDGPVILAADLNTADQDATEIDMLRPALLDALAAVGADGPTFPSSALHDRIDYIWVRGLDPITAAVVPSECSDHAAITAGLALCGSLR